MLQLRPLKCGKFLNFPIKYKIFTALDFIAGAVNLRAGGIMTSTFAIHIVNVKFRGIGKKKNKSLLEMLF